MNLAELSFFLIMLAGTLSSLGAVCAHGAETPSALPFVLWGVAGSITLGAASAKLATVVLHACPKRLHTDVALLLYMAIPIVSLLVVVLVPVWVADVLYGNM